jgi:hypothetical protein
MKNGSIQHVAPANASFYQNIVADWVPKSIGINDLEQAGAQIHLFPNPVIDKFNLQLILRQKSQVSVELIDVKGTPRLTLLRDILEGGEHSYEWLPKELKGASISSGLYLLKVSVNGRHETHKLIIK